MSNETNETRVVGVSVTEMLARLGEDRRAALELMLAGKSIAEAARTAGISRQTLYTWLRKDPVFQAAYNQWHAEMEESVRSRLQAMADKAAGAVEKALESGDGKLALTLLKEMGFLKGKEKARLLEPEDVRQQQEVEERRVKLELTRESNRIADKTELAEFGV